MPVLSPGGLVVLLEQVFAEVVFEVAPDAMNVVGVVLGIVVFDEEGRPLDAVVVGLTEFEAAGPGEADLVDSGFEDLGQIVGSKLGTEPLGVENDDRVDQFLLLGVEVGHHDAGRFQRTRLAEGQRENVFGGFRLINPLLLLVFGERLHELAGQIFLFAEHAKALARSGFDVGGIGAHEGRAGGDTLVRRRS